MTGGRNRTIRGIWRRAHSHRPGHDGLLTGLSRGIDARSFVFQGVRAMHGQPLSLVDLDLGHLGPVVRVRRVDYTGR